MKKGKLIILLLCAVSLSTVIGIFIGKNLKGNYAILPTNQNIQAPTSDDKAIDYRLDLNTATKVQLMELSGIGDTLAERIIEYRQTVDKFASIDDLLNIEGIGEKKLLEIEHMIKVGE